MRREWLVRALRTFVQAAFGFAAANAVGVIGGENVTKNAVAALIVASVAAGLAALMNIRTDGGGTAVAADTDAPPADGEDSADGAESEPCAAPAYKAEDAEPEPTYEATVTDFAAPAYEAEAADE